MNKYPILDEIFIDMLILFIGTKSERYGGLNVDDNYNIRLFLKEGLGLDSVFTSNWDFNLCDVSINIGVDIFTLDYNPSSFLCDILETLNESGVVNGLDVSNVGGFDE